MDLQHGVAAFISMAWHCDTIRHLSLGRARLAVDLRYLSMPDLLMLPEM